MSKGSWLNSPTVTALPLDMRNSVCPSGADLATVSAATMPPALGLLSMMTGWPSCEASFCATTREVTSATPPAPKGTTMRMGLFDRGWAWLVMAASSRAAQARALRVKRRLFMGLLSPGRRVWRKSAGRPRAPVFWLLCLGAIAVLQAHHIVHIRIARQQLGLDAAHREI